MQEKTFKDTRTQIHILQSRGLSITNKKYAKKIIRKIGYYNLINGYKDPFILTTTPHEKFIPYSKIEEIVSLYEFDRNLRLITLEYILKLEKEIKSLISYSFSSTYGHKNYLKLENFDIQGKNKYSRVCSLLSELYKKINLNINKDLSITHYANGKNYIPLWVLMNSISMGDLSKFYSNMLQKEREDVAKRLKWGIRENQLSSCLFFLSSIRNRCAHDERLYSFLSHTGLISNNYFHYFKNTVNNNYFCVIIAFKMLLSNKDFTDYISKFEILYSHTSSQIKSISMNKIRGIMGLPNNWRRLKSLK